MLLIKKVKNQTRSPHNVSIQYIYSILCILKPLNNSGYYIYSIYHIPNLLK